MNYNFTQYLRINKCFYTWRIPEIKNFIEIRSEPKFLQKLRHKYYKIQEVFTKHHENIFKRGIYDKVL